MIIYYHPITLYICTMHSRYNNSFINMMHNDSFEVKETIFCCTMIKWSNFPFTVHKTLSRQKLVVVDVNNLKNGRKPVKLQKESPAECAGEGKQSKGN